MENKIELKELREMAEIVKHNGLTKLAVSSGDFSILMECKKEFVPPPIGTPAPMTAPAVTEVSSPPAATFDGNIVKAPIVGTFYAASAPDKPSFVNVGQSVKKGDILMIIESMKVMNEIPSDFDGTVTEILVKNGDPVEFDQPIMIIK